MLNISQIHLKNFISHADTKLNLTIPQKVLIDGKSGHGKSSVIDAFIWCLYGRSRADNRSLIRRGAERAEVSVALIDGQTNDEYKITRSITNGGKHDLTVTHKKKKSFLPIKVNGVKNIQMFIERDLLKSSYLLFINSIAYPQDNQENFVKQTATKRKEIIMEMIKAEDYDTYYNKTKDKLNELKIALEKNLSRIESSQNTINTYKDIASGLNVLLAEKNNLEKQLTTLKEKLSELQINVDQKKVLDATINQKKNELLKTIKEIEIKQLDIDSQKMKLGSLNGMDISKMEADCAGLQEDKDTLKILQAESLILSDWLNRKMAVMSKKPAEVDFEEDIKTINKTIIDLTYQKVTICPEIQKPCPLYDKERQGKLEENKVLLKITYDKKKKQAEDVNEYIIKLAELGDEPVVDTEKINALSAVVSKKEKIFADFNRLKTTRDVDIKNTQEIIAKSQDDFNILVGLKETISEEITGIELKIKDLESFKVEASNVELNISTANTDMLDVVNKIASAENAKKLVEKEQENINIVTKENELVGDNTECLTLLKEAFSPTGIKAIIIDYIIPRMEEKINDILGKLSDFRVRLDTQKKGLGKDTVLEGLFISIFNELGEEFDFDNYSGSEKMRITYAISESLASIQNCGFRILDEFIHGLDTETEEKFANIILRLKNEVDQLFCITHIQSIKDLFEEKIFVKKINGLSSITYGY